MTVIHAADEGTRQIARKAVRENVRRVGELGQTNLEAVLRELDSARSRLVSMLATGTDFDRARARLMLFEVEREIARLKRDLPPILSRGFTDATKAGDRDMTAQARAILGETDGFRLSTGVSSDLIDLATGRSADLVTQITEIARSQINTVLRRAATGTLKPYEVATQLGAVLSEAGRPEGTFGTLALQIERVHRTETMALYQQAGDARRTKVAQESPYVIFSVWVTIIDGRERADHAEMNGATVEVGEHFNYGAGPTWSKVSYEQASREGGTLGLAVTGPHDPILPAKDAVNCRCGTGLKRGPRKDAR
jgi:hypothetical protein